MATSPVAPADLSDLVFDGAEQRLEELDRERRRDRDRAAAKAKRKWGRQVNADNPALGPPSPPMSESARQCACANPWLDPADPASCAKCGKALPAANGAPSTRGPNPIENGRESANATAEIAVPWTPDHERRLREVAHAAGDRKWELGDVALEAVPMGPRGRTSGALRLIGELAARVGIEATTLRTARSTSYAWPRSTRLTDVTWSGHAAHIVGGPNRARERAAYLRRLAEKADGRVTADLVRRERSLKRKPAADPFRSVLDAIGRLHARVGELPGGRSREGHASPAVLLERARQCDEIAAALRRLAA
jgi:hypothetical protein